jgi:predicted aldo/keto reductase-like oxidoreductase
LEYRRLGKTELQTSLLGFGGYHLLEIPVKEASYLLNTYLDAGGGYIETAASYGLGESERKIGASVSKRRDEFVLVSKVNPRDKETAASTIDQSLINLKTDHLDVLLLHGVENPDVLKRALQDDGSYAAALEAKKAGKVRHIGISMHGKPTSLLEAIKTGKFEVIMSTINYYDRCNFPEIEDELLPLAASTDTGVILMKPLADGFLYKNPETAFMYAFSRPISVVVAGINNREMLKKDLELAENYKPPGQEKIDAIFTDAPELGEYVCRQCEKCSCVRGIDIQEVFASEAYFDRQMMRGSVGDTAYYALSERLKFWFAQKQDGYDRYAKLNPNADTCDETCEGPCRAMCPYNIDIKYKMRLAGYKLGQKKIY